MVKEKFNQFTFCNLHLKVIGCVVCTPFFEWECGMLLTEWKDSGEEFGDLQDL